MVDASNPTQLSASCVQLLGLLSAEELANASVLILFNKMYVSVRQAGVQVCPRAELLWRVTKRVAHWGVGGAQ
jgi:hypothetical protein